MSRRRIHGFSVIEIVVAIAILAGSVAALMNMGTTESRTVEMSEERLTGIMLLSEMQQTLSGRSYAFYQAFPANEAGFDSLSESLVLDNKTVFNPADATDTSELAQHLRDTLKRMKVKRYVLFEPFVTAAGNPAGIVKYLVTYEGKAGVQKKVSTFEVVYETNPGG